MILQPAGAVAEAAVRLTTPEKVPVGVIVIVEVPAVLAVVVIDVGLGGLAESVKVPPTVTGTLTVLDSAPLVPVTTTVNPVKLGSGLHMTDRVLPEMVAVQPAG